MYETMELTLKIRDNPRKSGKGESRRKLTLIVLFLDTNVDCHLINYSVKEAKRRARYLRYKYCSW